ncbi:hypothetical protein OAM56_05915 [Alphaproteobacteria bacterium]|nr:hypothetical protein [Alphaproteobacteria bacterium]
MDNNYLIRLKALQSKNFLSLQNLQKEMDLLEYQQNSQANKSVFGSMTNNNDPKDGTKARLEKVNSKITKIQKSINELEYLEFFSGTVDDLKIVDYVDGHLDKDENKLFKRLIKVDEKLKKEIELMKSANSFFGEFEDEFEDLDESILKNWLEVEEISKKNNLTLARPKTQLQDIIFKIKDFIRIRPIELGFAGIAPLAIGAGLLYGTNATIVASNPAIIQVAELSQDYQNLYKSNIIDSFPGSYTMTRSGDKNKIINGFKCSLPDININNKSFIKYFNVRVTNPKTKKVFSVLNKDKILNGNKIDFYFNFKKQGTIYIDNVINSNDKMLQNDYELEACVTSNLLSANYFPDKKIKIGDTFTVTSPWQKEMLLVSFLEKGQSEKLILGKLKYQPTNLKNFNENFNNIQWNFNIKSKILKSDGLYQLYSELYKKPLYAPNIKSWANKVNNSNNDDIYIDFNGDNKAEMIAITDINNMIIYYVLDTNADSIGDVLVYPKIIDKKYVNFQLLIDTNYDGEIDQIGEDINGDWKLDSTKDI